MKSKKTKAIKIKRAQSRKSGNANALIISMDYFYGLKSINWYEDHEDIIDVRTYMQKRGFKKSTLINCDAKITYNKSYPIVFPMYDNSHFKGWVCRTTNKIIEKKRKYLYNEGFSRRDTLVGKYKNCKTVMLVEGYMDKLKMNQFGIKHVCAILGWKVTQQQIEKLKEQGVTTIISALDMDSCGRKGTEYLKNFFDVVNFQYPPGVKDAGDMTYKMFVKANEKTKKLLRRKSK